MEHRVRRAGTTAGSVEKEEDMATAPGAAPSLKIKRVFQAPREKVFAAWTQKEQLEKWMCKPHPDMTTTYLKFDVREGGSHALECHLPNGQLYVNHGTYKTVRPPEKLVFTWEWERFDEQRKKVGGLTGTLVTVDFYERGGATEVVLSHEFFPSEQERDAHNRGWNLTFNLLEKVTAS
jgi:uncharacterized protein YndB with AHSA1/START domain